MDALEGVGGLRSGLETIRRVWAAGELKLRPQADTLIGVRQEPREFSRGGLGDATVDERGHRGDGLRLHHLAGLEGHETSGLVGLPSGNEVGDDESSLPVVLNVGRSHAPEELVRRGHLHTSARGLHLEGPDAGRAGGATVIANQEMLGFRFEEAGARVISQARRARGDVGRRRNNEGRLRGILKLPDLLGHPSRKRPLLETNRAKEGVHGLVLHLPTRIGTLDNIHHAGSVALVRVIVHGEAVTEIIEGDLLRVTQAEVHDLEVRAVRLEAEHGAAVAGVVLLAFLGREVETAIADRAPDAAVVPDGEAVHVVAGERDAHAEAVL